MLKKIIASLVFSSSFTLIHANIGTRGFIDYPNDYFVETGTFGGDGVIRALKDGFKYVKTIEADMGLYKNNQITFQNYPNVELWQGSSANMLWAMIENIDAPITFWLDAHVYPPKESPNCPLIEELEQIKMHPIKTHTILIDDMSCCGSLAFDFLTREDLISKIKEINEDYEIYYICGGNDDEVPNNIMVAEIRKK